ncbi:hypothetical protein C8A03DRAFT_39053 [Achaetomium macrosporum]|uniref:Uncharacterized protein n=1 Tax=Achaetomium macrosporum TaxID=79813 RepID=A0AAN7H3D6_9PEZI|nr:hypothetical protein C8A03DRAFT_39053 [Achaetomium macrosporum]
MARIPLALLLLAILVTIASASVPSFCKCTCFQNSTIIPLGPQHDNNNNPAAPPPKPPSPSSSSLSSSTISPSSEAATTTSQPRSGLLHLLSSRESSTSCAQCNRAFCQKYNLPICKGAEDKDIKTMCFQRDSRKDQIIVWGFILGTAGLLGWAGLRRVVDSAKERQRARGLGQGRAGGGRFGVGVGGLPLGGGVDGAGGGSNRRGSALSRRTGSGGGGGRGGVDRGLYDPLEDGHDGSAARRPG